MANQQVNQSTIAEVGSDRPIEFLNEEIIETNLINETESDVPITQPNLSDHSYLSSEPVGQERSRPTPLTLSEIQALERTRGSTNSLNDPIPMNQSSNVAGPLQGSLGYLGTVPSGSSHGGLGVAGSELFNIPQNDPENPISFKEALEFIPKTFDGQNVPVGRFIRDCIYARNAIAAKNRHHLFLMIRSRIVGNAYDALLDRDIVTLEQLLKTLKDKYTKYRNLGQLNSSLATVSQKHNETVTEYGDRVGNILKDIIEVIEEAKPNSVLRVRLEKPNTLQEAISIGRGVEWELDYVKNLTGEKREKNETMNFDRGYQGNRFRPYKPSARVHAIKQEIRGGFLNSASGNQVRDGGKSVRSGRREGGSNASTAMTCFRCGEEGHLARGCVRSFSSETKFCPRCTKSGHLLQDCPGGKPENKCFKCSKVGHYARNCPQSFTANKTNKFCKYCKKTGHEINECKALSRTVEENKNEKRSSLNEK